MYIPSNKELIFIYNSNHEKVLYFNYANASTSSVAYCNVMKFKELEFLGEDISNLISESDFMYKTNIDKTGEIILYPSHSKFNKEIAVFKLIPKFNKI